MKTLLRDAVTVSSASASRKRIAFDVKDHAPKAAPAPIEVIRKLARRFWKHKCDPDHRKGWQFDAKWSPKTAATGVSSFLAVKFIINFNELRALPVASCRMKFDRLRVCLLRRRKLS